MMKKVITALNIFTVRTVMLFILLVTASGASAQIDYNKQFFDGKSLFREGKYNLAMETFKPLIAYDQRNQFSEYASFYYGLAAYKQGYRSVAKDMFNQLKTLHGTWDKMEEVNYWIAIIHFENKDYFQGLKLLSAIQDKKLQKDIPQLKMQHLRTITDVETLKMMYEEYPKDEIVVHELARALAQHPADVEGRKQLEDLISKFNLKRTDYIPEAPKTFFKDVYSVSVLLPFMANSLEPSPARKKNQIVLDLYEGMKQAVDTLEKQGIKISLRAYDTERNAEKIRRVLATEELKNTDLIVGPLFPEENKVVQDFSLANKINVFNPVSNNSDVIGTNPYAFLMQPSFETLGRKSADFLADHIRRKNVMVFYGISRNDSILAANFIQKAGERKMRITGVHKINKDASRILNILATPTEHDEYRNPKQFTLAKDSLGSIFVATDEALIYAKVSSAVETRGDSVTILGSENWLSEPALDMDKYQTLGIILFAPRFTVLSNPAYLAFEKKFVRIHGRVPNSFARLGYEFMLFAGQQLKKNGVYFQDGLTREKVIPGVLSEGYNFETTHDNQLVPFIKFIGGQPVVIDKR